jgi:hypothetical protein
LWISTIYIRQNKFIGMASHMHASVGRHRHPA